MNAFCLGNNDDQHAPRIFRLALPRGVKERVSETSARKKLDGRRGSKDSRNKCFFFFLNWIIVSFILIVVSWNCYQLFLRSKYLLTSSRVLRFVEILMCNYIELFLFYYWYEKERCDEDRAVSLDLVQHSLNRFLFNK